MKTRTTRKSRGPQPSDEDLRRRARAWLEKLLVEGEAARSESARAATATPNATSARTAPPAKEGTLNERGRPSQGRPALDPAVS
jgi:hypothetical protein